MMSSKGLKQLKPAGPTGEVSLQLINRLTGKPVNLATKTDLVVFYA